MRRLFFLAAAGLFLAACGAAASSPVRQFTKGDELAYYDFTETGTFEEGIYADGQARFQIRDGVYSILLTEGDNELWYGQWGDSAHDVVVDAEARQYTQSQNTMYGVMCRVRGAVGQQPTGDTALEALAADAQESAPLVAQADVTEEATEVADATTEATDEATVEATTEADATAEADETAEATTEATDEATAEATEAVSEATVEASTSDLVDSTGNPNNGDGYLFLVNGGGQFAIMRSLGGNVSPLVNWTASSVIKPGADANRIRAVCLGDYLAMYVNGSFVGDVIDDTYTQGQVGLVGASADRLGLMVQFDNLMVSAALAN